MTEKEWVNTIIPEIEQSLQNDSDNLKVVAGRTTNRNHFKWSGMDSCESAKSSTALGLATE